MATQGSLGTLSVDIRANMDSFNRNMSTVQNRINEVSKKMKDIGKTMTASLTLPILAAGAASVKLASDFEESLNKVDVAFKDNSGEVKEWSKTTLKSFGIAQGTALDMVSLFGDMSTSMGLSTGEASKMSRTLVGLAGDLASFKNIRIEEAETALKSIYTGETESLKNLGVVMTQVNLEQFAMSKGINKRIADMTEAEKVNLRYNFVLEKTKNAHGDFERTGAGAANQMRIFTEGLKQLGQQIGTILLPIATDLISKLNGLVNWFSSLGENTKTTIIIITGLVAILGPLLLLIGTLIPAVTTLVTVVAGISAPVWIVIGAIGALTAVFIHLWRTNEDFRKAVVKIWIKIKQTAIDIFQNTLMPALRDVFENISKTAQFIFNNLMIFWDKWGSDILMVISVYWNQIKSTIEAVINIIRNIIVAVLALIRGDWETFGNALSGIIETLVKYIKNTLNNFAPIFERIWLGFKNIVFHIWNGIKSIVSDSITWIVSKIEAVMKRINAVKDAAKNIGSGVKSVGSRIVTGAKSIVGFETGTNYVPNDGLAYLHKGEAVVPAKYNNHRWMGSGIVVNVTGNTISGQREADKMASSIVSRLRVAGVNP